MSLYNIYAPNNQSNQIEFMQELNNCIIDKTELTALIVGGDWNCTLSRKDKIGGTPWKPSNYSNLVLTTMDKFDLVDIQRVRYLLGTKPLINSSDNSIATTLLRAHGGPQSKRAHPT